MDSVRLVNFNSSKAHSFHEKYIALFIMSLLMIILSSCSRVSRPDGPPNIYVDERRIPNAVPKAEPLARYGNMPSYRVFGKRYFVMKSWKHYNETGIASWYGTKFHSRRTSSGEPYNLFAMTAAHKYLPLPTYVEVTNLENNRKIIVKVNDRGPFVDNRLIDLSYVGAKKLGMLGRGTAHVRVRAIDPLKYGRPVWYSQRFPQKKRGRFIPVNDIAVENYKPLVTQAPRMASASHHLVYLQVGAFRNKINALRLKAQLANLIAAPIKISYPYGKLYLVQVGPIKDLMTADKLTHKLKVLGIKSNKVYGA